MKLDIKIKKDLNAVIVNNKYLIDITSGIVYYDYSYSGKRTPDIPEYVYTIRDLIINIR